MERIGNFSLCVSYSAKQGVLDQEKLHGNPYQVLEIVSAREKIKECAYLSSNALP